MKKGWFDIAEDQHTPGEIELIRYNFLCRFMFDFLTFLEFNERPGFDPNEYSYAQIYQDIIKFFVKRVHNWYVEKLSPMNYLKS